MQNLINIKCLNPNCSNKFDIYESSYVKKKKLYCCRKCRSEHHWLVTPLYEKPCLGCGVPMKRKFLQKLDRLKYCSPMCRKEHKNRIFQEKLKDEVKSNCSVCGKELINKREPCGKLIPRKTCGECTKEISKKTALNMCNIVNNRYKTDESFRKKIRSGDDVRRQKTKDHYKTHGMSKKWIEWYKNISITGKSKIEYKVADYLTQKNIKFEQWYNVSNIFVDIFIPEKNLIVECQGDYWHMSPTKYKNGDYNKLTKRTAEQQWEKDKNRKMFLESKGYKIVELWESEINNGDYKKLNIYL